MPRRTWQPREQGGPVGRLLVGDAPFSCRGGGEERLIRRRLLVNTRVASGVGGVPDEELEGLECGACGHLHRFTPREDR